MGPAFPIRVESAWSLLHHEIFDTLISEHVLETDMRYMRSVEDVDPHSLSGFPRTQASSLPFFLVLRLVSRVDYSFLNIDFHLEDTLLIQQYVRPSQHALVHLGHRYLQYCECDRPRSPYHRRISCYGLLRDREIRNQLLAFAHQNYPRPLS